MEAEKTGKCHWCGKDGAPAHRHEDYSTPIYAHDKERIHKNDEGFPATCWEIFCRWSYLMEQG